MKVCVALVALVACVSAQGDGDLGAVQGLACPAAGYMFPDSDNLCFVWFCERGGEPPIKRACPKGVRVPSWWEGGTLNMCNIVNILKHGGEPTCLRCAASDVRPADTCEDLVDPCPPECTCETTEHTHRCDCPVELGVFDDGFAVDMPVNHCEPNPCENGASCQNQWDGFFCFCPNGWTGHRCETSVCDWHPCLNGGTCVIDEIGYHCECPPCWSGSCCNVTEPCPGTVCPPCSTPNSNGGCDPVGEDYCGESGVCNEETGECDDCDDCFTGPTCKIRLDTCKCNNNCPLNSDCEDLSDKPTHECVCHDCYGGQNCDQPIKNCDNCNPCPDDQVCSANGNQVTCGCSSNCVTGPNCDQQVNNCDCNNPCDSGSTCVDTENGPVCQCSPCKAGAYCGDDVQTCECVKPCPEGQQCSQDDNGFNCGCSDNCYTGEKCDQRVNTCECNNPCTENQICSMSGDGPVCSCGNPCRTGDNCETEIYSCACSNPCEHGGRCEDGENGISCMDCEDCWGGEFCKDRIEDCGKCNPCDPENQECYMEGVDAKCECKECMGGENCDTPLNTCACNDPCTEDQQICLDGEDGPVCEIGNPSAGNAFTIVFEENHTEKSLRQVPLEIYLTPSVPDSGSRTVNINSAGLAEDNYCYFDDTLVIPENDVLRYEVDRCMRHNKTGLDHVAIKITEVDNKAMIVYGMNKDRWSADGFLATPDIQAGKLYQTASYSPAHRGTQFAVVGLRDNTEVELTLADDNDLPAPYNTKGSKYTFTLNAFETFQVQAACPVERGNKKSYCSKDLSGSIIKSDKVVHAFSGNIRAFVEAGEGLSRDHLVEQLIPTDRWGKYFGFVSVPERAVGDLLNIMALDGRPTKVDVYYDNEHQEHTLPVGGRLNKHVEIPSGKRVVIKSTEPLSVTQLTKSKDTYLYKNESVHDPVSITVPPVEQFTNNFFFSTPEFTGGKDFHLMPYQQTLALVVAKKGEEQTITLGGKAITDYVLPWGDMPSVNGGDDLVGAVFVFPHGTSLIQNAAGRNFQCLIYGFDDRESYGLPAGMGFKKM